jgi:hypothetical protein
MKAQTRMTVGLHDVLNSSYEFAVNLCSYLTKTDLYNLLTAVFVQGSNGWMTRYGQFYRTVRKPTPTLHLYFHPNRFTHDTTFHVSIAEVYYPTNLYRIDLWHPFSRSNRIRLDRAQVETLALGARQTNFTYGFLKPGHMFDLSNELDKKPYNLCQRLNNIYIKSGKRHKKKFVLRIINFDNKMSR